MPIIISRDGKDATKIQESGVPQEAYLQEYVAANPDVLPLEDLKEGIRLLTIDREFPTRSGPIDVLAIDSEGGLFIIETKLFRNPDKRTVVAQMLDYGAALWSEFGDAASFLAALEARLVQRTGEGLTQHLVDAFDLPEEDAPRVLSQLTGNLAEGRFSFVVLMDRLHDRLRDLVLFLNQRSSFDVYAVEMEFYRHEGLEIVIPKLFGGQVRKEVGGGSNRETRQWDETSFIKELKERCGGEVAEAAHQLIEWLKPRVSQLQWGSGVKDGSCAPVMKVRGISCRLFYLWTGGDLNPYVSPLPEDPAFDVGAFRSELADRLNAIDGMDVSVDKVATWQEAQRIEVLCSEPAMTAFKNVCSWVIERLRVLDP